MINGLTLRDAYISAANSISNARQPVDELNVFPVPDGDTGTNMSMTMNSAARALSQAENLSCGEISELAASALLRGARGNSGVILSLLFRGFARGLKDVTEADGIKIAESLALGVESAYKAVMKPTEGTILTVARVASEKAKIEAQRTDNPVTVLEAALAGAEEALLQTPELLPVLKQAGVVDAGGKGFVVILTGMLSVIRDGQIAQAASAANQTGEAKSLSAAAEYEGEITFTYCTEFIVNRDKSVMLEPLKLRAYIESIGDSAVVVDDEQIIKVHVHTNDPGQAIQEALKFGPLVNIKIDNMREQHEKSRHDAKREKPVETSAGEYTPVKPEKPFGFVSVAAGDGLATLFVDLGVDSLVKGGQTMNPSTEDILRAIELTPAETVFVLPNNKNIIMAAEQAAPLATRKVIVINTRTV
ncbi:MAG: DAK2 domain-containing protein, partial [Oscillospiraceae bacterium]|nr:DAK2 domain-containing protein [Oscillospiraceae bacterium]